MSQAHQIWLLTPKGPGAYTAVLPSLLDLLLTTKLRGTNPRTVAGVAVAGIGVAVGIAVGGGGIGEGGGTTTGTPSVLEVATTMPAIHAGAPLYSTCHQSA